MYIFTYCTFKFSPGELMAGYCNNCFITELICRIRSNASRHGVLVCDFPGWLKRARFLKAKPPMLCQGCVGVAP